MGNKTVKTTKYWRGEMGQWGLPPTYGTYLHTGFFSRIGSDRPKFQQAINDGQNATNYMLVTAQEFNYSRPNVVIQRVSGGDPLLAGTQIQTKYLNNNGYGYGAHTKLAKAGFMTDVGNKALLGIIKKIRKHETSDFSGPTFAGELRETLHMLKSPFRALREKLQIFTDLEMRIRRDRAERRARRKRSQYVDDEADWSFVVAQTWLEFVFGVRPLIADIKAILEVYFEQKARFFPNGLQRLSYRFTDNYMETLNSGLDCAWPGTDFFWKFDRVVHYQGSVQYVVWIDNRFNTSADGSIDRLYDLCKIRLDEIIPTTWELLPWSFLIDYFTNIGDVLGCYFDYNRSVKFGKITSRERNTMFDLPGAYRNTASSPKNFTVTADPWTYTSVYTRIERQAIASLGIPDLSFNLPSIGQLTNIAALVRSLSKRNPFKG